MSIHTALFRHRSISILPPLNAFQAKKACPKVREGSSQTPLKRAPWLEMLIPQPVPTGTPPNHTSEAFGVLSNMRGGVCFTAHVSESPEQRLEQMQSIEHIPSPGCIAARGSAGTSAPASPAPSTHLASSAISSGGARGESPPTSSWEQGAFPHGANISGTTGNVQLDYNALRKGHGGISALYLELCSFRAGQDGKSQLALARGIRTAPTASRGAGGAQKPPPALRGTATRHHRRAGGHTPDHAKAFPVFTPKLPNPQLILHSARPSAFETGPNTPKKQGRAASNS